MRTAHKSSAKLNFGFPAISAVPLLLCFFDDAGLLHVTKKTPPASESVLFESAFGWSFHFKMTNLYDIPDTGHMFSSETDDASMPFYF